MFYTVLKVALRKADHSSMAGWRLNTLMIAIEYTELGMALNRPVIAQSHIFAAPRMGL